MFNMNKMKSWDAAAKFPELAKLKSKVVNNPKIKAYLAARKETAM